MGNTAGKVGRAKAGRPARTNIQQICVDTGCSFDDLPGTMDNRDRWGERVREIRIYIYIYIYISVFSYTNIPVCQCVSNPVSSLLSFSTYFSLFVYIYIYIYIDISVTVCSYLSILFCCYIYIYIYIFQSVYIYLSTNMFKCIYLRLFIYIVHVDMEKKLFPRKELINSPFADGLKNVTC